MKNNAKFKTSYIRNLLFAFYLFGMLILCLVHRPKDISDTERRALAQMPEINYETISEGSFMSDFETYSLDQFPMRDHLRSFKSFIAYYPLAQLDQNNIYISQGYASAYNYPQNEEMMNYAGNRFQDIYDKYLDGTNTHLYFSIVPDKNCYLDTLHPAIDYVQFNQNMASRVPYMTYIDLLEEFDMSSYYYTDTHIRQNHMIPAANKLLGAMNDTSTTLIQENDYVLKTLDIPFYGVYYGQSALPLKPDQINYYTNTELENCIVTSYDTGKAAPSYMYDFKKASGKDPYEFFLSGSVALMTIENPGAVSDKELILFRDSYGSSIAPLFVHYYSKITLVDTRYVNPGMLGNFITFDDQDVLFLYSSLLLNNSLALKK